MMNHQVTYEQTAEKALLDATRQFLTFSIDHEQFGVDIMTVREIKGWTTVTRLPNTPEYLCGVMNLRGVIVPIFDLKCRLTGQRAQINASSVIIILSVAKRNIGILVDSVSDILDVSLQAIKPPPEVDGKSDKDYIGGLISLDNRMVVVLDMENVFENKEIDLGNHAA